MSRLLLLLALLPASGCAIADACVALCYYGPKAVEQEMNRKPPDRSTTHCETLPGAVYAAENGDELRFQATHVEWRHGGTVETRAWRCRENRTIVLSGFEHDWQGRLRFAGNGLLHGSSSTWRIVGADSTHVYPCEVIVGRSFFGENGDVLTLVDAHTAQWTTAAGTTTLRYGCADRKITFRDGSHEIAHFSPGGLSEGMERFGPMPSFVRWNGVEMKWGPDGKRPLFACDQLAGETFRRGDNGETLVFGAKTVEWRRSFETRTMEWTCFDGKLSLSPGDPRSDGNVVPDGSWLRWDQGRFERVAK